MNITDLRKQYPTCIYESYTHTLRGNDCHVEFTFTISDMAFHPYVVFSDIPHDSDYRQFPEKYNTFFFLLGCIELFSYWKLTASPTIQIRPHTLSVKELNFWYTLLDKGMAEYRYRNGIKSNDCTVEIQTHGEEVNTVGDLHVQKRALIPVGGGKDSALTLGIFSQSDVDYGTLLLNPIPAADACAVYTKKPIVRVSRYIDPLLLQKNTEGFLNGHTPFSAYLAFLSITAGALYSYSDIVLSNERSAEEETVMDEGIPVFHQYSKTFAFEKEFSEYSKQFVTQKIQYWSILRPLFEIQIAERLSKFPEYLRFITSCNRKGKENVWCGTCPKCVSTYILLSPFFDTDALVHLFNKDMFTDQSLYPRIQELIDPKMTRPFECVGTREETILALAIICQQYKDTQKNIPPLLEHIQKEYLAYEKNIDVRLSTIAASWGEDSLIPAEYKTLIH